MSSTDSLEKAMIILYACGGVVELYILCSCVQQLFDAVSFVPWYTIYNDVVTVRKVFVTQ